MGIVKKTMPGQRAHQEDTGITTSTVRTVWRHFAIGVAGLIAFVILAGWNDVLPVVTVPLLVGGYLGLVLRKPLNAAVVGAIDGLLGGFLAARFYQVEQAIAFIRKLPSWWHRDVPVSFYTHTILPLFRSLHWSDPSWLAGGFLLCAAFAAGVARAVNSRDDEKVHQTARLVSAWLLIGLLCVCFYVTANRSSTGLRRFISIEPANMSYRYDALDYVKTLYLMKRGIGYYPAAVGGAAQDARGPRDGGWVKDGKMIGLWPTPAYIRMPLIFELWNRMGKTAAGVVRWSDFLSALCLIALFAGFKRRMQERALMIPFLLFPWLLAHGSTINLFFPDWWAALASIYAVALIAADVPLAAAVVLLVGAIFRFTALPMLLALFAASLLLLAYPEERPRMLMVAAGCGAAFAVFLTFWVWHTAIAANYIDPALLAKAPFGGLLASFSCPGVLAARPLSVRLLAPTDYFMYAYGFGCFSLVWLFGTSLAGLGVALRRSRLAQITLLLFLAEWLLYLVLIGPSSSYWGQMYTSVLIIGTGALLGILDVLPGAVAEMCLRFTGGSESGYRSLH